jgi:hypothetical protein
MQRKQDGRIIDTMDVRQMHSNWKHDRIIYETKNGII